MYDVLCNSLTKFSRRDAWTIKTSCWPFCPLFKFYQLSNWVRVPPGRLGLQLKLFRSLTAKNVGKKPKTPSFPFEWSKLIEAKYGKLLLHLQFDKIQSVVIKAYFVASNSDSKLDWKGILVIALSSTPYLKAEFVHRMAVSGIFLIEILDASKEIIKIPQAAPVPSKVTSTLLLGRSLLKSLLFFSDCGHQDAGPAIRVALGDSDLWRVHSASSVRGSALIYFHLFSYPESEWRKAPKYFLHSDDA